MRRFKKLLFSSSLFPSHFSYLFFFLLFDSRTHAFRKKKASLDTNWMEREILYHTFYVEIHRKVVRIQRFNLFLLHTFILAINANFSD